MTHSRTRRFARRRPREYPLPNRGMSYQDLAAALPRRDIRHAISGGELLRGGRGLYYPVPDAAADHHLATLQALCAGTPHIISHETAAALWGIIQEEAGPPLHVTSPPGGSRVKRPDLVTAHRCQVLDVDQREMSGLRLTSPARTWVDVAASVGLLEALVLADRCRRAGRPEYGQSAEPLASGEELRAAVARRGRTRGLANVRSALDLSRDAVDSPMETLLRYYMHEAGLPEPEVNAWLRDEYGNPIVQPDLSIWDYRVAIQYEGWEFHSDPQQMLKDVRRHEDTEALGWLEVRITKAHMRHSASAAIAKISHALRRRGWPH